MTMYFRLLKQPNYFRLWLSSAISQIGDWFHMIVLLALIARITNGSGIAVSLYLLAGAAPSILVMPYAGVLADKFDRKRLLIISDILRGVVILGLIVGAITESLVLLYGLTIIRAVLTAIFVPAKSAIIPNIVEKDELVHANTIESVTWSAMLAFGSMLGGVVAAIIGSIPALFIDAGTFLVSAYFISRIDIDSQALDISPVSSVHHKKRGSIREGLDYVREHPSMIGTLLVKAGGALSNHDSLFPIFATQTFAFGLATANDSGEGTLGFLFMMAGVGAVMGPIVFNRFSDGSERALRRFISLGFILVTLGWFGLVFASAPPTATLLLAGMAILISSAGGSANWTYSTILIQKASEDAVMGRMFSLDQMAFQIAAAVSTLLTGALIDLFGVNQIHYAVLAKAIISLIPLAIWFGSQVYVRRRTRIRRQIA